MPKLSAREVRDLFEEQMARTPGLPRAERALAFRALIADLRRSGVIDDEVAERVQPRGLLTRGAWRARQQLAGVALLVVVLALGAVVWVVDWLVDVSGVRKPS